MEQHDYRSVCEADAVRWAWLNDVERFGFSLLNNVPTAAETLLEVVALFGFVRQTNYGRIFDVRTEERPNNLAYTPAALSVHTDNPYRCPPPTLQLLHCLKQADEGGVTALVDGFHAAERMREQDPQAFARLTETDVVFRYESEDAVLEASGPIIALDSARRVRQIRINNRSLAPLRLAFEDVMPFYEALFRFRELLEAPDAQLRIRLQPGELVMFDNDRVLHGRIGESRGTRHLQGCYADRDGLLSTLRLLDSRLDRK